MISEELDEINRTFTNVEEGIKIELTEGNKRYLAFHRDNIFRKMGGVEQESDLMQIE